MPLSFHYTVHYAGRIKDLCRALAAMPVSVCHLLQVLKPELGSHPRSSLHGVCMFSSCLRGVCLVCGCAVVGWRPARDLFLPVLAGIGSSRPPLPCGSIYHHAVPVLVEFKTLKVYHCFIQNLYFSFFGLGLSVDCHDLFLKGERQSGLYAIQPVNSQPFQAYCEMTDGGWTVIQRRRDGSVDFDQLWQDYKNGFGDFNGEFWLGLERIRALTQQGGYVLHIELKDWSDQTQFIEFPFSLGGENTSYSLYVQGVATGSVENALTNDLTGVPFSTRDRDNDLKQDINCAKHLSGGWWFSNCGRANLNGKYFSRIPRQRHERKQGVFWKTWRGRYYPLKSTLMKIAPAELEYES
uniref:Angiopoietin-like 4 n=1 Tax=Erpetoichthys calabaricus TaxID=27687 RepID=A0A8C4TIF2_ERPCA